MRLGISCTLPQTTCRSGIGSFRCDSNCLWSEAYADLEWCQDTSLHSLLHQHWQNKILGKNSASGKNNYYHSYSASVGAQEWVYLLCRLVSITQPRASAFLVSGCISCHDLILVITYSKGITPLALLLFFYTDCLWICSSQVHSDLTTNIHSSLLH